jgi:hypothetical protein
MAFKFNPLNAESGMRTEFKTTLGTGPTSPGGKNSAFE